MKKAVGIIHRCLFLKVAMVFAFVSCSTKEEIKKNILEMSSHPVTIEVKEMEKWSPRDNDSFEEEKGFKQIIYADSSQCTSCFINHLIEWKELISIEDEKNSNIQFIFILEPQEGESNNIRKHLEASGFDHFVFIDKKSIFRKANPHIPTEVQYHLFLLDKDNNVVLVGDPVHNERIKKLFFNRLKLVD